jgi:hypothetical protein
LCVKIFNKRSKVLKFTARACKYFGEKVLDLMFMMVKINNREVGKAKHAETLQFKSDWQNNQESELN